MSMIKINKEKAGKWITLCCILRVYRSDCNWCIKLEFNGIRISLYTKNNSERIEILSAYNIIKYISWYYCDKSKIYSNIFYYKALVLLLKECIWKCHCAYKIFIIFYAYNECTYKLFNWIHLKSFNYPRLILLKYNKIIIKIVILRLNIYFRPNLNLNIYTKLCLFFFRFCVYGINYLWEYLFWIFNVYL